VKDDILRSTMKPEETLKRETERLLQLEEEAMKKKISVPVMLFRRRGMKHPNDKSDKKRVQKLKEKMLKKRNHFMTL
jgi:hypothetical protein